MKKDKTYYALNQTLYFTAGTIILLVTAVSRGDFPLTVAAIAFLSGCVFGLAGIGCNDDDRRD